METQTDNERKHPLREEYKLTLTQTFTRFLKPFVKKEDPRFLSVGCGFGYESGVIRDLFPNSTYLGIDIEPSTLYGARIINTDLPKEFAFDEKDARKKEAFGDKPWDVIILRHPQVLGSILDSSTTRDWQRVIENSCDAVIQDGVLFCTVLSEYERTIVLDTLKRKNIDVIVNEVNPTPSSGGREDWAVIVGKKK